MLRPCDIAFLAWRSPSKHTPAETSLRAHLALSFSCLQQHVYKTSRIFRYLIMHCDSFYKESSRHYTIFLSWVSISAIYMLFIMYCEIFLNIQHSILWVIIPCYLPISFFVTTHKNLI